MLHFFFRIVSSHDNIRNTFFNQKSPQPPEGCFATSQTDKQIERQTDGHRDSMTESAQWANSVKLMSGGCNSALQEMTDASKK